MLISLTRCLIEMVKQRRADSIINKRKCIVMLKSSHVIKETHIDKVKVSENDDLTFKVMNWEDVNEGDIIEIAKDEKVPADCVLLTSSEPLGKIYNDLIRTKAH